jgi:SAM-dependent methyltransferase
MAELKYIFNPDKFSGHWRILRLVKQMSATPLAILDVGTAQGYISKELSQHGHKMYGIEFDPDWAAAAQPYCRDIQVGDLDALEPKFPTQFFDVIILSSVLEHLKHPDHVLCRISHCLKSGGKIVVAVPNVANWYIRLCLLLGRFDYQERGILDRTHLHFYTWKTFKQLLADCGFRITYSEVAPIPLPLVFPLMASGKPFYFCHVINNVLSNLRRPFFAFEFIVVAERSSK